MKKYLSLIIFLLFSLSSFAQNEDSTWFVNNYTKLEQYIPMRDGIKLFTSIYIPKDQSSKASFFNDSVLLILVLLMVKKNFAIMGFL